MQPKSFVKVMGVSVYAALGHIEQSVQADPLVLGPGDTERSRGGTQSSGGERHETKPFWKKNALIVQWKHMRRFQKIPQGG